MKMQKKKIICHVLVFVMFICIGYYSSVNIHNILHADEGTSTPSTDVSNPTISAITSIKLSEKSISITQSKKGILKATIKYDKNTSLPKETVLWKSNNTSVATVNKKGIVKAINSGTTYIICMSKSGDVKARCKVVVRAPYNKIKSIKFTQKEIKINVYNKRTLVPSIQYGPNTKYKKEPVVWSSTDNKILTVRNGTIKAKQKGTVYVKVKSKYTNKTAKCKVTVTKKLKYIAFTFDDGPGDYTDKLLNALEKNHSKATFFVLGNRAKVYQKQLKREFHLGMEIGSHTWSHQNLNAISKKQIKSEIFKARDAIKSVTGQKPTLLRPPYGNYNPTVSKNAEVPMIYWSVDTEDWKHRDAQYICNYIMSHAHDGEIILLHDIHPTSVDGFIKALPKLRKKGFELVTVSDLYSIKGKKLKNGVMHFGPNNDK